MRAFSALFLSLTLMAGTAFADVKKAALHIQEIVEAMVKTGNAKDKQLLAALDMATENLWKQGNVGGNWEQTLKAYEALSGKLDMLSGAVSNTFEYTTDRGKTFQAGVGPLKNAFGDLHQAATGSPYKKSRVKKEGRGELPADVMRVLDNAIDNHLQLAYSAGSKHAKIAETYEAAVAFRNVAKDPKSKQAAQKQSFNQLLDPLRSAIVLVQKLDTGSANNRIIVDNMTNATRLLIQVHSYFDSSRKTMMEISAVPVYEQRELSRYLSLLGNVY